MKTNKTILKLCFFIMMLMFITPHGVLAQNEKKEVKNPGPQTLSQKSQGESDAMRELNNFHFDASNPQLSEMKQELLKFKVLLEEGQKGNSLSKNDEAEIRASIAKLENAINSSNSSNSTASKKVVTSVNEILVTDPSQLKVRDGNKTYLTLSEFNNAPAEKQKTILAYNESYVIVKNADMIPPYSMTRAEFNKLPAEKQAKVKQSAVKIVD